MDIAPLVDQFGLPVGLLVYFIWLDYRKSKEHKEEIKKLTVSAVEALNRSSLALERLDKKRSR